MRGPAAWAVCARVAACVARGPAASNDAHTLTTVAGFVVLEVLEGAARARDGALDVEGDVFFALPGFAGVARVRTQATVRADAGVMRLVSGRVRVALPVEARGAKAGELVSLDVAAGRIRARGAVLDLSQGPVVGLASVLEGEARLHAPDGRVWPITSGETLRWPLGLGERAP